MKYFFVIFSLVAGVLLALADDVILPPIDASGPSVAMIFAPGAGLDTDTYIPLAQSMQQKMSAVGKSLWVGVTQVPFDTAAIGLEKAVQRVADSLNAAGLPEDHSTLYAGHSLGGAMIPLLVEDPSKLPAGFDKPIGMVLMGAFLVRDFKTDAVPEVGPGQYVFNTCPVLTIGGEMDGLCRITRIAESYHTQIDMSTSSNARHELPVTVIEGMSHMQFSSGEPTKFVTARDLLPEISIDDAHDAAADDVAAFAQGLLDNNWSALDKRMGSTAALVKPIVEALQLEGYHQFLPPCYCEAVDEYGGLQYGTCPEQPGCQANAPWTQQAQQIMAGTTTGTTTVTKDSQHEVTEDHPSCHLPHVHDGTDSSGKTKSNTEPSANPGHNGSTPALCDDYTTCTLDITTVTQLVYQSGSEWDIWRFTNFGSDSIDTGYFPISAREMKSKMKSRQAVMQAASNPTAGVEDDTLDELDGEEAGRCAEINQAALDYALSVVPSTTKDRYLQHGQQMKVDLVDEHVCAAGPCWIWSTLQFNGRKNTDYVEVKAPSFPYQNSNAFPCGEQGVEDEKLPCAAGMHYCKLLSPARAVEWMYVDSLRRDYSLKSANKGVKDEDVVPGGEDPNDPDAKCCTACEEDEEKYYSIAHLLHNCGESCLNPEDFKKYKLFEPGLTLADSPTPCADRNYTTYLKTAVHGEHSPLDPIAVDLYKPAQPQQ